MSCTQFFIKHIHITNVRKTVIGTADINSFVFSQTKKLQWQEIFLSFYGIFHSLTTQNKYNDTNLCCPPLRFMMSVHLFGKSRKSNRKSVLSDTFAVVMLNNLKLCNFTENYCICSHISTLIYLHNKKNHMSELNQKVT